MIQVDVFAVRWQQDSDGAWLCLRVQSPQVAMNACDEYQADKEHVAQIRRKGRSLDANAYCWVLLDKRAADDFIRRWTAQGIGWMAERGPSKTHPRPVGSRMARRRYIRRWPENAALLGL